MGDLEVGASQVYCDSEVSCRRVEEDDKHEAKYEEKLKYEEDDKHEAKYEERLKYEKKLEGLRRMGFMNDCIQTLSWFLGFCALTWASAVLLGAYVARLRKKDYYEVFMLLLVEGFRFGLVVLYRSLGSYRLGPWLRYTFRSAEFALPLGMGSFALFSILPSKYDYLHNWISGRPSNNSSSPITKINAQTSSNSTVPYDNLDASLNIFYACILLNATILLFRSIFNAFLRIKYVIHSSKSLGKYHDKVLSCASSETWMHVDRVDLGYGFTMQSYDYRKHRNDNSDGSSTSWKRESSHEYTRKSEDNIRKSHERAIDICKEYADVVWFLYIHERGFEMAEEVMKGGDVYMREAAANMVGFWAVLEKMEGNKGWRTPLRLQKGMVTQLQDMAENSYGPSGTAAARAIALLLKLDPHIVGSRRDQLDAVIRERFNQLSSQSPPHSPHIDNHLILPPNFVHYIHTHPHSPHIDNHLILPPNFVYYIHTHLSALPQHKYSIMKTVWRCLKDVTIPLSAFLIGFLAYALIIRNL